MKLVNQNNIMKQIQADKMNQKNEIKNENDTSAPPPPSTTSTPTPTGTPQDTPGKPEKEKKNVEYKKPISIVLLKEKINRICISLQGLNFKEKELKNLWNSNKK